LLAHGLFEFLIEHGSLTGADQPATKHPKQVCKISSRIAGIKKLNHETPVERTVNRRIIRNVCISLLMLVLGAPTQATDPTVSEPVLTASQAGELIVANLIRLGRGRNGRSAVLASAGS
jgi:hypothetical protein